ncbi:MAG: cache domain-containing protein [Thermodesulfobacteriota bacterium]
MSRLVLALRRLSVRAKLLYGYTAAGLLVVGAGSLLLFLSLQGMVERDIENHLSTTTTAILNLVHTSVDTSIRNHLRAAAEKNLDVVRHFHAQAAKGALTEQQAKARAAEVLLSQTIGTTGYIYCVDSRGRIQAHPSPELLGKDLSEHAFIREQTRRREGYVEYDWANPGEAAPRAKALYMTYFEPWDWIISASSYREEFRGLVRVDDFRERILSITFGETGYPYVMDFTGTLVIHPALEGTNIAASTDSAGREFIREMLRRKDGTIVYPWRNPGEPRPREKLVVFNSIPEMGWIVASSSYLEEFYHPLHVLAYGTAAMAAGMILVLLPLTWWIGAAVTRPLAPLLESLAAGARGDLSRRLDEAQGGEFGRLAAYYNHFMDSLETSRRRLGESEAKYRAIFEHAVEGIFQSRPDGTFIGANPAMARMFGYPGPRDLVDGVRDIRAQIYADPGDRDRLLESLGRQDQVADMDVRFLRRDGGVFWGTISARAVRSEQGRILYLEGIVKDVTAQHEALEALTRAKEEAEAASRLKDDFLSVVSHEMLTPLTSVTGYAKLARRKLAAKVRPALAPGRGDADRAAQRMDANLAVVEAEADNLTRLISDVLDLSRLGSGVQPLHPEPVRAENLAARAHGAALDAAADKGLELEVRVEPGLPPVMADPDRAHQVLLHLLGNALKFTDAGRITLSVRPGDNAVEFAVRDTGPGIPAESLEKIFAPFTQLGDVLTGKPRGTGLGLALCRSIVALHHGRLWAESAPGQGSVFRFTLPLAGETPA